jgi:hypothetical protein
MNVDKNDYYNILHKELIMKQMPPPIRVTEHHRINHENNNVNNNDYINFNYYRDNITHNRIQKTWGDTFKNALSFLKCW